MLNVNEIYPAVCGESSFSGRPCTLVRLTGCHQRCIWCDSAHAFHEGTAMSSEDVRAEIASHDWPLVLVTGGEPLLQRPVLGLLSDLVDAGSTVLLETSGTLPVTNAAGLAEVPAGVHRIVDLKAPGSGVDPADLDWEGIATLGTTDEIKIVVTGREDYDWARGVFGTSRLPAGTPVLLSPAHGLLDPRELAAWVLEDGLDVRLQIQLHKVVWPDVERGV
ncbi:MAG: radical SAM protein [bacterium]|nr:radical SAM protein [bacterium]